MLGIEKVFAQTSAIGNIVGKVENPLKDTGYASLTGGGLTLLFTNIIRLVFVGASLFSLLNLVLAGFQYMSAGGDSKAISAAWDRIWQTLLGLILLIGSFALAALFGYVVFGDATYILNPKVYGPR